MSKGEPFHVALFLHSNDAFKRRLLVCCSYVKMRLTVARGYTNCTKTIICILSGARAGAARGSSMIDRRRQIMAYNFLRQMNPNDLLTFFMMQEMFFN